MDARQLKQWLIMLCAALLVSACSTTAQPSKETIGTGAGAVLGGVVGHQIGGGTTGTIIGGAVGALLGRELGQRMDAQDEQKAVSALESNSTKSWSNPTTNTQYTVAPTNTFQRNGELCRDYTTTVQIEGQPQTGSGTACRQPDGSWKLVG